MKKILLGEESWSDARGWGVKPLAAAGLASEVVKEMHLVSLEPGAVRGNHLHELGREWIVIFGGQASIAWRSENRASIQIDRIDPATTAMFEIPPGLPHAIRNDSALTIFILSLSDCAEPGAVPVADLFEAK